METNDFMEISLWGCLHFMAGCYVLGIDINWGSHFGYTM